MTCLVLLIFVGIYIFEVICTSDRRILRIYGITAAAETYNKPIVTAWNIAIDDINQNPDVLPNYQLELVVFTAKTEQDAFFLASQIAEYIRNPPDDIIVAPIVLGSPLSSHSKIIANILNFHHIAQISTTAASTSLSNITTFYRLIANNKYQRQADIPLCKYFGWNKINVIYPNDEYGKNAKNMLLSASQRDQSFPMEIATEGYDPGDILSMQKVANDIKNNDYFINIVITLSADTNTVLNQFLKMNLLQFPYYFITRLLPDFDTHQVDKNIAKSLQGYPARIPASYPSMITLDKYRKFNIYGGNETIYNISNHLYKAFSNKWNEWFLQNSSSTFNKSKPYGYAYLAYDVPFVAAYILQHIDNLYGLNNVCNDSHRFVLMDEISQFMKELNFVGVSGKISFDKYGDRTDYMFLWVTIGNDGQMQVIGVSTDDNYNFHKMNNSWPKGFRNQPPYHPVSEPIIKYETAFVEIELFIIVSSSVVFSIILVIFIVIKMWLAFIRNRIKLLDGCYIMSICIGCIICYIDIVRIGWHFYFDQSMTNLQYIAAVFSLGIAFTFMFAPIFLEMLIICDRVNCAETGRNQTSSNTFILLMTMVWIVDILLLVVALIFGSVSVTHRNIELFEINQIYFIQFQYFGYKWCYFGEIWFYIFIGYQLLKFGSLVYYSFRVFKMKYKTRFYNNICKLFFSIMVTSVILVIIGFLLIFSNDIVVRDHTKLWIISAFIQLLTIVMGNVVLFCNIIPKLRYKNGYNQTIDVHVECTNATQDEEVEDVEGTGTFLYSGLNSSEHPVSKILELTISHS
eukprot:328100_1